MKRTFKFIADKNNGVKEVNGLDGYKGLKIVDEDTFLNSLTTLSDNDFIGAELCELTVLKLIVSDWFKRQQVI